MCGSHTEQGYWPTTKCLLLFPFWKKAALYRTEWKVLSTKKSMHRLRWLVDLITVGWDLTTEERVKSSHLKSLLTHRQWEFGKVFFSILAIHTMKTSCRRKYAEALSAAALPSRCCDFCVSARANLVEPVNMDLYIFFRVNGTDGKLWINPFYWMRIWWKVLNWMAY